MFALLTLVGLAGGFSLLRNWSDETWGTRDLHAAIAPLLLCYAATVGDRIMRPRWAAALAAAASVGFVISCLGALFYYGSLHGVIGKAGQSTLEALQSDPIGNHYRFNARLLGIWVSRLGGRRAPTVDAVPSMVFRPPDGAPPWISVDLRPMRTLSIVDSRLGPSHGCLVSIWALESWGRVDHLDCVARPEKGRVREGQHQCARRARTDEPPVGAPMNCMVTGLAKTGTTILLPASATASAGPGVLLRAEDRGRVRAHRLERRAHQYPDESIAAESPPAQPVIARFDPIVLIVGDPRDQFISQMLYTFYDFKIRDDRAGYERARDLLRRKIESPSTVSTIQLYDSIASLAGRPGAGRPGSRGWRGDTRGWCAFSTSTGRTRSGTRISWMAGSRASCTTWACLSPPPPGRRRHRRVVRTKTQASGGRGSPPRTSTHQ